MGRIGLMSRIRAASSGRLHVKMQASIVTVDAAI